MTSADGAADRDAERGDGDERSTRLRLGLRANWPQFGLLVLINAFVGGMVGLERTVVPLVGTQEFGLEPGVVAFSFVIAFGVVKGLANLAAGVGADRFSRKKVLIAGWVIGIPVPFILAYAPSWSWIIAANVLLGLNQGLAWSMTVIMKIDLVGPRSRGLAMGLNEAAGYGALGLTALVTGYIAAQSGLRPDPFYIGMVYAVLGLVLSILLVRDTGAYAAMEARLHPAPAGTDQAVPSVRWVVAETSWRNRSLFGTSQAGLVNNLNDGMSWAVFPVLFAAFGVGVADIGLIKAVYPVIWGVGQLFTGVLADRIGRKPLIVWGMILQAVAHLVIGLGIDLDPFVAGMVGSVLLGLGTAMVYPALLASVADHAHPAWRAGAVGVYRTWRDLGYAVGALMAGIVATILDLKWAIHAAGILTFLSAVVAWLTIRDLARGALASPAVDHKATLR